MKSYLQKSGFVWMAIFILIFLLTQDFFLLKWSPLPGAVGFPNWIFWYAGIHVLFVAAFYLFSRYYWREEEQGTY